MYFPNHRLGCGLVGSVVPYPEMQSPRPSPTIPAVLSLRDSATTSLPLIRDGNVKVYQLLSHVRLSATPWTVVCQDPLSVEFSRQEYWSGLPCPPPADLLNPGIEPKSLASTCIGSQVLYHSQHLGCPTMHKS